MSRFSSRWAVAAAALLAAGCKFNEITIPETAPAIVVHAVLNPALLTQVVLVERGVKGFDTFTRNLFDVAAVPAVRMLSHLPIIVDPSHATGRPDLIPSMACAAVAAGADGVHVEVHSCPEKALSDGPQALLPHQYKDLVARMRKLAEVVGKTLG